MGRDLSPEAREKLSLIAKERHAKGGFGDPKETGKLGGRPKMGSRRRQRITQRVVEAAEEEKNAQAIINVFKDSIHPSQPMHVRLKGAEAWAKIAADNHKVELVQEAQGEAVKSRDELVAILKEKLSGGPVANIIAKQIEQETGIVDATVVEDEDADQAA